MKRQWFLLQTVLLAAFFSLQAAAVFAGTPDDDGFDPAPPPDPAASCILVLRAEPADAAAALVGAGIYQSAAEVQVSASPAVGYTFSHWSKDGAVVSTSAAFAYILTEGNYTLVAHFTALPRRALTLDASPAGGAVLRGAGNYYSGEQVRVACTPAPDYTFLRWERNGTAVSLDTAFFFSMPDEDAALSAVCRYEPYRTLTASADDALAGRVVLTQGGSAPLSVPAHLAVGTTVQLAAAPNSDYLFSHWLLNGTYFTNQATFTYTLGLQDAAFVAVFDYDPQQPTDPALNIRNKVFLVAEPEGAATFNYAASGEYAEGTQLALTATTKTGYRPDGWYSDDEKLANQTLNGQIATLNYTVTSVARVTLTYRAVPIVYSQLNLVSSPAGAVTFNTTSGNIYEEGTALTLRAVLADGYVFDGWYAGEELLARSTALDYTITGQAATLVARATKVETDDDDDDWDPLPPTEPDLETVYVIVQSENTGKGNAYGSASYVVGKEITIRAVANEGYMFSHWSDGSTEAERTFVVETAVTYTAYFVPKTYRVTVLSSDEAYGTVAGGGDYAYHSSATLQAVPAEGCTFLRWSDDNTEAVHNIYVASDTTLTAYFAPPAYRLSTAVAYEGTGIVTGAGTYSKDEVATVEALPAEDYMFLQWTDGATDNPRTLTLTQDTLLTAAFRHLAALKSITYDGVGVPDFDEEVLEYTITLPASQTVPPVIAAEPMDADSRVVLIQASMLPGQASVVVIGKTGALRTYTVRFVRALSSDATLSSLMCDGVLVPDFKSTRLTYNVPLPSNTSPVPVITATPTDPGARVVVIQATAFPGQASVVVVASDGVATLTYTVILEIGLSNDAALGSLSCDGVPVEGFTPDQLSYVVSVPKGSPVPWVEAEPAHGLATVDVTQATVLPGEAQVKVTAEDGTTRIYLIYFAVNDLPTWLENVNSDGEQTNSKPHVRKLLRDGTLYLLRDGKLYTVTGIPVQ